MVISPNILHQQQLAMQLLHMQ